MRGLESWTHRYFLERLSKMVDAAATRGGNDHRGDMLMYVDLAELVLKDGKPLDIEDPALMFLIRFLDKTGRRTIENLAEVFDGIRSHFNPPPAKDWRQEVDIDLIHDFFGMKNSGGWEEVDRVVNHLIGQTLTALVDRIQSNLLYDPADPGLGGGDCFTLCYDGGGDGFETSVNGGVMVPFTKAAFGSAPEYIIGFIPKVAAIACEEFRGAGGPFLTYIECKNNRDLLFTIPFGPAKNGTEYPGVDGAKPELLDFSKSVIYWGQIKWEQSSLYLMKAIAKLAPLEARHLVKGSYLEDSLGM